MSHILFIEARFFDPTETRYTLEERFKCYLLDLRAGKLRSKRALTEEIDDIDAEDDDLPSFEVDPLVIHKLGGPVTYLCRSRCSFKPLSVRRRPGFSNPMLSAVDADCKSR